MTHPRPLNKLPRAMSISVDKRIWVWFNASSGNPGVSRGGK